MAIDRQRRTYRVRQLPPHINQQLLAKFLVALDAGLGPQDNIIVYSVAPDLNPWEQFPNKTATIMFKKTPAVFDNDDNQWNISPEHVAWDRNILFDVHFLGFTPLNEVDPNNHVLDCIAVSGLASHPFGSWKQKGLESTFMWLRDGVPREIPQQIRSIIYGYDTSLLMSESFKTVDDIALQLIRRLRYIGCANPSAKPLVIFAHSLGGIILKRALLELANTDDIENCILDRIQEIVLFGVPNKGMKMSHLLAMVRDQPNEALIQNLSQQSTNLRDLDKAFSSIAMLHQLKIFSVYETLRSRTVQKSLQGEWERSGPFEILVEKDSAVHQNSSATDSVSIDQNHSNLVKFSEDDPDYRIIIDELHTLIRGSTRPKKLRKSAESVPRGATIAQARYTENSTPSHNVPSVLDNKEKRAALLLSLKFDELDWRMDGIESNYGETFDWLWIDSRLRFKEWLQSDQDMFWISDKSHVESTRLQQKCNDCSLLLSRPRFKLQKSFEGLLRGIIYQILSSTSTNPDLLDNFFHHQSDSPSGQIYDWSLSNLLKVLETLKQSETLLDVCLFLDALDECDAPPQFLARFIKSLSELNSRSTTRFKVIFSSRPWNLFNDEFETAPGFKIHEYTRTDISRYISGKIGHSKSMSSVLSSNNVVDKSEQERLVREIERRTEGVFLWLRLVMDELLTAHANSASLRELREVLGSFPGEIEAFYANIIYKIPREHRWESFSMLEILLRSERTMRFDDFQAAVICASGNDFRTCAQKISDLQNNQASREQFQRRLKSRCGGLIECTGDYPQFMHQTVKEFVRRPGFRQLILQEHHFLHMENGHSFLAKYELIRIEKMLADESELLDVLPETTSSFLFHAHAAESTTGESQKSLIDDAGSGWFENFFLHSRTLNCTSLLSFAVMSDLRLLLQATLFESLPRLTIDSNPSESLLHVAIHALYKLDSDFIASGFQDFLDSERKLRTHSEMISLLFRLGADRSRIYEDCTPFQLLVSLHWRYSSRIRNNYLYDPEREEIIKVFLEHGQDPNIDIIMTGGVEIVWEIVPGYNYGESVRCTPLHLANFDIKMTRVLLDYGADVNALDDRGYTPLDYCLYSISNYPIRHDSIPKSSSICARLLLQHGGCVTLKGARSLPLLLDYADRAGMIIGELLRNAPLLDIDKDEQLRELDEVRGQQSDAIDHTPGPPRRRIQSNRRPPHLHSGVIDHPQGLPFLQTQSKGLPVPQQSGILDHPSNPPRLRTESNRRPTQSKAVEDPPHPSRQQNQSQRLSVYRQSFIIDHTPVSPRLRTAANRQPAQSKVVEDPPHPSRLQNQSKRLPPRRKSQKANPKGFRKILLALREFFRRKSSPG